MQLLFSRNKAHTHNTDYCEDFFEIFYDCGNILHTRSVLLKAGMHDHAVLLLHIDSYYLDDALFFSFFFS